MPSSDVVQNRNMTDRMSLGPRTCSGNNLCAKIPPSRAPV